MPTITYSTEVIVDRPSQAGHLYPRGELEKAVVAFNNNQIRIIMLVLDGAFESALATHSIAHAFIDTDDILKVVAVPIAGAAFNVFKMIDISDLVLNLVGTTTVMAGMCSDIDISHFTFYERVKFPEKKVKIIRVPTD